MRLYRYCAGGALRQNRRRHRAVHGKSVTTAALPLPLAFVLFPFVSGKRLVTNAGMEGAVSNIQALRAAVDLGGGLGANLTVELANAFPTLETLAQRFARTVIPAQVRGSVNVVVRPVLALFSPGLPGWRTLAVRPGTRRRRNSSGVSGPPAAAVRPRADEYVSV